MTFELIVPLLIAPQNNFHSEKDEHICYSWLFFVDQWYTSYGPEVWLHVYKAAHRRCTNRSVNIFCIYLDNCQEKYAGKKCKSIPHRNRRQSEKAKKTEL